MPEQVIRKALEDELVESYLNYSMSVIIGRAIPDVRDGLKPVQRRILYGMMELGLTHKSPFKKSARIVGEVLGKYHPHGDAAVYDALVRMAQPFTMRYPLIEGQGNFGSIDRDPPAAMRYTEARLTKLAEEMLEDLDKNTVPMVQNFDGTLYEPEVLPSKVPNLLINGSSGIAVGMSTSIPPHNLSEIVDAIVAFIENPDISVSELMNYVKGPDFPTGGIVVNPDSLRTIYETGKGSVKIRGKVHVEEGKKLNKIVITEIPYMVSKAALIEEIARYAQSDELVRIKNIRDESDKRGMRVVVEVSKDVDWRVVLKNLYAKTSLQTSFTVQMLVIDDKKRPRLMNLKELIEAFVRHRFSVIRKRAQYEYSQLSRRAHVLEGLMKAARAIDTVVDIVRSSKSVDEAKKELVDTLGVTEEQAKAILDMRLYRLTVLEMEKLLEEYVEINKRMERSRRIIEEDEEVYRVMKEELLDLKERYGDERRTQIGTEEEEEYSSEDLIVDEDVVITLSRKGYIKSTLLRSYRLQRRGGKGLKGAKVSDEDAIILMTTGRLKGRTLFITSLGRAFALKNYEIDTSSRGTKGRKIGSYFKLEEGERILEMVPLNGSEGDLVITTRRGKIKRIEMEEIRSAVKGRGIRIIKLEEGDSVAAASISRLDEDTVILATKKGNAIRFSVSEVRRMGRSASGVAGIRLSKDDEVVGMVVSSSEEGYILTVTSGGFGKRTPISEYRLQKRGGLGIKNISNTGDTVAGIALVNDDDEVLLITKKGNVIRFMASDVSIQGRYSRGVKLIVLSDDDEISQVTVVR